MFSSRGRFFLFYWSAYLVFLSVYLYNSKKQEYQNSEKVRAIVIDRIESTGRRNHYFYPQFQFRYNDSNYVSADKLYWTRFKNPGAKLTVIFPKGDPEQAVVYTLVSYWIVLPAVCISFMIAFLVFAVIVFFKWNDQWRPQ